MIYRIKFEKREEVKYIGHLDTMRTFTRCIKRTKLPIKFSSGFNPRVQLSFALPLAVGVTSECEYFDLELNGDVETDFVISELSKTMPSGFKILTCEKFEKVKSLMSLVKEAVYEINLDVNTDEIENKVEDIKNLFSQDAIEITKEGKAGKEEIKDIKPMIIDFIVEEINYRAIRVTVHCSAGSKDNLNPNYILQAIKTLFGEEVLEDYDIHRKELILE
ncbi:MAG: DUF2344 domain-containing protein [Clostridia bacterium]|nr:DUF2344 domain-containing protein [Clostridia bacterium]